MAKPTHELMTQAKRVLRYLKGTCNYKLVLGGCRGSDAAGEGELGAVIYSDADFANCVETRRSVTGYLLMFGGSPIAWASRRQPIVTKSTTAAEHVAASQATDELMHFKKLLKDLGAASTPILLRQDNQATAKGLNNPIEDGKMKYLAIHYHFVRERIACGDIKVEWVPTDKMLADMFTKPLPPEKLKEMCGKIGLVEG